MDNNKELKWGSILSYIQLVINIVVGVLYSPIMIRLLGQSEYGLYSTVASTISMLSILSLGFNSSYVKYFAIYRKQNDVEKVYRLNGLFLIIFFIIGIVALACGLFLTTHLDLVFDKGLSNEEYDIAKILMLLLAINLSVSFPMSVFRTIISANERFIFLKILGMLTTIIGPLVNLPLLLMGIRSIGLVVSSLVFSMVSDSICIFYVVVRLKNKFIFKKVEKTLFKSLFSFTFFIALNMIVDEINNGLDRVLLGRYQGTISVAIYSVGASLYAYYRNISIGVSGVFTTRVHQIYNAYDSSEERDKELSILFIKVGRIQYLILMLFASGIVFFGKQFIYFWVGEGYNDSYYVLLLLTIPATIPSIQNIGIEIQRAANKHQFRSIIYFFMALLNLILTINLCQVYGAIGAVIGTCISILFANGIIMNIFYYKKLNINIPLFWKNIFRITLGMIPAFVIGFLIKSFIRFNNIGVMIMYIIIYTIIYFLCVRFFSMNMFEKNLIGSITSKFKKKKGVS